MIADIAIALATLVFFVVISLAMFVGTYVVARWTLKKLRDSDDGRDK